MTKNSWTLITLAVVLAVLYVFRFTDLGARPRIQINVSSRPFMPNAGPDDVLPILFGFDRDLQLTALKVTPLSLLTNSATASTAKPVWHLKAKSVSEAVRGFHFGDAIGGMESVGGPPENLIPGIGYRLELETGKARGAVDFTPQPALPSRN